LYPERVQESKVDVYFLGYKENGLKHTNNAALTSATERRQSKANNTERENMKECGG
jgi:hypothetical protein